MLPGMHALSLRKVCPYLVVTLPRVALNLRVNSTHLLSMLSLRPSDAYLTYLGSSTSKLQLHCNYFIAVLVHGDLPM